MVDVTRLREIERDLALVGRVGATLAARSGECARATASPTAAAGDLRRAPRMPCGRRGRASACSPATRRSSSRRSGARASRSGRATLLPSHRVASSASIAPQGPWAEPWGPCQETATGTRDDHRGPARLRVRPDRPRRPRRRRHRHRHARRPLRPARSSRSGAARRLQHDCRAPCWPTGSTPIAASARSGRRSRETLDDARSGPCSSRSSSLPRATSSATRR